MEEGLDALAEASTVKETENHDVIDEAIRDQGDGYTVFSVPVGLLYRPSEKKLKNAMTKDYMGKAKLVAATDATDVYTEFSGSARLKDGISPTGIYVDRPGLARSATAPSSRLPRTEGDAEPVPKPSTNLARAQTTINVPSNFRDRIAGRAEASSAPAISRNNTMSKPNTPAPSNGTTAPDRFTRSSSLSGPDRSKGLASLSRGPSTKRAPPSALEIRPVPEKAPSGGEKRVSEFYENYLDEYGGSESAAPGPTLPAKPVPDRSRRQRESTMSRNSGLRSAPVGGSMRRRGTSKRFTRGSSRAYEEEEEGYGSGDYEEFSLDNMQKIRVKIHYKDEVRGMALLGDTTFAEFMDKVTSKFEKSMTGLGIKFKDEDGGQVSLRDESDFELALETAREAANGKSEGKMEIWCLDL